MRLERETPFDRCPFRYLSLLTPAEPVAGYHRETRASSTPSRGFPEPSGTDAAELNEGCHRKAAEWVGVQKMVAVRSRALWDPEVFPLLAPFLDSA